MRTVKAVFIAAALLTALALDAAQKPKYIIMFIGDGMATPQRMLAEEYSRKTGSGPLAMNSLPFQATLRTASTDSLVTDSAAAATALACGVKTRNYAVGVDASGAKAASCAEIARDAGMKVGLVTTVTLTHATPACFYSHRKNRGETYNIAIDLVKSRFDFFAGGGFGMDEDRNNPRWGKYGNAWDYASRSGYKIVRTRDEFLSLKPCNGKIATHFTDDYLQLAIDTDDKDCGEPTIEEMTAKAIEMLDGPQGFFLMVEGARIDWAGHANDAASNIHETIALDRAVKVALAFLARHPGETLVSVTGDHETGGLSMGYSGAGYAIYTERLAGQKSSLEWFAAKAREMFAENPSIEFDGIKPLIEKSFSLKFSGDASKNPLVLGKREIQSIESAFKHDLKLHRAKVKENTKYDAKKLYRLGPACRTALAHKAGLEWGSSNHTALPVMVTSAGAGAEEFTGFLEIEEYGRRMKSLCAATGK